MLRQAKFDDRLRNMLHLWKTLQEAHKEAYGLLVQERATVRSCGTSDMAYLTDLIYLCKQARDMAHDIRKELDMFTNVAEKVTSLLWTQIGTGESLSGHIAVGVPIPGVALSPPSKTSNPEAYAAIMQAMGIPEEWWQGNNDVVKPHFPGLADYATKILTEGGNLPPAFAALKETPRFTVSSRKHKDVDVDALCKQYPMMKDECDG